VLTVRAKLLDRTARSSPALPSPLPTTISSVAAVPSKDRCRNRARRRLSSSSTS